MSENYSLLNGSPVINYYESLKSPAISANLSFLDVDGVVSNESIMGGEMLRFTVDFGELGTFSIDENKHKLMIGGVNNVRTQSLVNKLPHWMQYLLSLLSTKQA